MAHVLFVCLHNAGRSQISEVFFNELACGRHEGRSAGTQPAERVHPEVAEVMREVGHEIGQRTPQRLTDHLAEWADVVVTMGCGDECPYIPGRRYLDWQLQDPAGQTVEQVRDLRDQIRARIVALIGELDAHPVA